MRPANHGFTLVELLISTLIVVLISTVLILVYRGNLASWKWGQKHMDFNMSVQLAMKQVFTDIKRINPEVDQDSAGQLWFKGEKIGDLVPNLVVILDTDQKTENGGEEITFVQMLYSQPGKKTTIRLFLENGALMREVADEKGQRKKTVIANRVSNLHFTKPDDGISEVGVGMTITDDRNPDLKEDILFSVHLDTDLVCVKFVVATT